MSQPAQEQQPITVYTTDWCAYCIRAKHLLDKRGYAYREINVQGDHDRRAWLVKVTGQRTVPQIFVGDTSIGGYREIADLDRRGELERLVFSRA